MSPASLRIAGVLLLALSPLAAGGQHPLRHFADAIDARYDARHPVVRYSLRVDTTGHGAFDVEMHVRNVTDTFRLGMAAHREYDDRYSRYVEGLRVERTSDAGAVGRAAAVQKIDSTLWRITGSGGAVVIHYRVKLPSPDQSQRAAWRPFVASTGTLTGGPHTFMYVMGATLSPVHVALDIPAGWSVATGLEPTSDPLVFFAPSVDVLVDSPIFAGRVREWRFVADGAPHRVVYWPGPSATPFDTAGLVRGIETLANQAIALFGRAPYREFTFVYQDDAYGGLEHYNSITLGARSSLLAQGLTDVLEETAHEYFHAWNLMRIRPLEYRGVTPRVTERSRGLWFSEGATIYYADLLRRRGGLPVEFPTRIARLEHNIAYYFDHPGNHRISPERASVAEYGSEPGSLGNYDPSPHLQGELLTAMLDLRVRSATNGRRSMDDVMRAMLARFSGERGFTSDDVQRTVASVCGCAAAAFFAAHVRGSTPIDFARDLALAGLGVSITREPATNAAGERQPDNRVAAWTPAGEEGLRLIVNHPDGAWARAGLNTRDPVRALNGTPVRSWYEFRATVGSARIGDTVRVEVARAGTPVLVPVPITGYERHIVRITELPNPTARQRRVREQWLAGHPSSQ